MSVSVRCKLNPAFTHLSPSSTAAKSDMAAQSAELLGLSSKYGNSHSWDVSSTEAVLAATEALRSHCPRVMSLDVPSCDALQSLVKACLLYTSDAADE